MLEILRHPYVRDGHAIGQIVEYAGPVVERLSVDERATMTNMAAEVGAFTGLVAADERTVEFLVQERGGGVPGVWRGATRANTSPDRMTCTVRTVRSETDGPQARRLLVCEGPDTARNSRIHAAASVPTRTTPSTPPGLAPGYGPVAISTKR